MSLFSTPHSFSYMTDLQERIESFVAQTDEPGGVNRGAAGDAVADLVRALNAGDIRAAEPSDDGTWETNEWVKEGILLGFQIGRTVDYSSERFPFYDKNTFPVKPLRKADDVRLVPGGSSIRTGSYVAPGVVCMPPMYVNVGAYVNEETMIDSHALVGSCAQIGKRVHLSASAQVGGVLEPVHAAPVIVEDDVFVGGNAGLYEGCIVREGAVLAAGVTLTASTQLYDLAEETVHAASDGPLEVPAGAVVVPGSRSVDSEFGQKHGLSLSAPIVVKYRDADTDAATALEDTLR
jgi:2,3,4,5-tetrahydropyridine-2-carboxylate N-succinyltransferase